MKQGNSFADVKAHTSARAANIDLAKIYSDAQEIERFVLRTPLIRLPWLDTPNRTVWAKLECNQLTNSFKVRGAYNAIRKISPGATIIAASAGNHGLAIACVAEKLGRKSKIFIPVSASEIKLRRLISMGAEVIPAGKDVYEATQIAREVANDIEGEFISPFSHPDVVIGQGSLAVEVLGQHGSFDQILVPLGGGGLLIGCGLVFKDQLKSCEIRAIHPKTFQRNFNEGYERALKKGVYPTIADGLAVQHSDDDHTHSLVAGAADAVDQVSEYDIELGITAMLNNEGLLVEGAGAIGVAALINDPEGKKYHGDVLILICGGNISTASLMRALATPTEDNKLGRLLGHRSIQLPVEAVKYNGGQIAESVTSKTSAASEKEYDELWPSLINGVVADIDVFKRELKRHEEYLIEQKLNYQPKIIEHIKAEIVSTLALVSGGKKSLKPWQLRDVYRLLIQKYSFMRNSLAWCSASSDQVGRVMLFDPAENANPCNYDRYGTLLLRERELAMQRALNFDVESTDLLLTSSGQAAYTVVESFLLRECLTPNPTIVVAPYIYFESLEQIEALKNVKLVTSESWEIKDLIELVESSKAEVLFMDALANLGTPHIIDFAKFAEELEGHNWSRKWLIVDGTMVSGGYSPFAIFNKPNHPKVLYYESGSKYLQLGLDLQMAGVVVCPREYGSQLAMHRRNTGTVMYQANLMKFPRYNREQFLVRMRRLTRNAEMLTVALKTYDRGGEKIGVAYPTTWRKLGWQHGGGVVPVTMQNEGLNNRQCLDYLIELILKECATEKASLTKGVSFGFSTTRVSAAAAMAQNRPPFLRFSIGEEEAWEMKRICKAVTQALDKFFDFYKEV